MKRLFEVKSVSHAARICALLTLAAVAATLVFAELIAYLLNYPGNWQQYVLRALIPLVVTPMLVIPLINMNMRLNTLRAEMQALARTDALTGLMNRRAFFEEAVLALSSGSKGVAVMMIDVDKFKTFNDTHGHDAGDAVLAMIANAIAMVTNAVGPASGTCLARIGGEEFALLVTSISSERAEKLGAAICAHVRASQCHYRGHDLHATVSIGVALGTGAETIEELLKAADTAVYEAKRSGRDRWCMATAAGIAAGIGASHGLRERPRAA